MALSNSQYDQLMRDYEQLQLDNEHELRLRFDEVYDPRGAAPDHRAHRGPEG